MPKSKKKVEKLKVTKEKVEEVAGTPLPEGYDPDLPMNKQREFNGLI